jgi:hypothetical protein
MLRRNLYFLAFMALVALWPSTSSCRKVALNGGVSVTAERDDSTGKWHLKYVTVNIAGYSSQPVPYYYPWNTSGGNYDYGQLGYADWFYSNKIKGSAVKIRKAPDDVNKVICLDAMNNPICEATLPNREYYQSGVKHKSIALQAIDWDYTHLGDFWFYVTFDPVSTCAACPLHGTAENY